MCTNQQQNNKQYIEVSCWTHSNKVHWRVCVPNIFQTATTTNSQIMLHLIHLHSNGWQLSVVFLTINEQQIFTKFSLAMSTKYLSCWLCASLIDFQYTLIQIYATSSISAGIIALAMWRSRTGFLPANGLDSQTMPQPSWYKHTCPSGTAKPNRHFARKTSWSDLEHPSGGLRRSCLDQIRSDNNIPPAILWRGAVCLMWRNGPSRLCNNNADKYPRNVADVNNDLELYCKLDITILALNMSLNHHQINVNSHALTHSIVWTSTCWQDAVLKCSMLVSSAAYMQRQTAIDKVITW